MNVTPRFDAVKVLVAALLWAENGNVASQEIQTAYSVLVSIRAFELIWSVGLVVFGLHLLIMGMLIRQAKFIPSWIGILLQIAAFSYMIVHTYRIITPEVSSLFNTLETILSVPMAVGELSLAIWLLLRGGRARQAKVTAKA